MRTTFKRWVRAPLAGPSRVELTSLSRGELYGEERGSFALVS